MQNVILGVLQTQLGLPDAPSTDTRLEALGVTSFGFIEIVLRIENETGLEFEDRYLNHLEFQTVADVISYCRGLGPPTG